MTDKRIEIMDTTLRDGEQTPLVSFNVAEKVRIAELLLDKLNVPRIEIASAGVSAGDADAVRQICSWAEKKEKLNLVEVLGFVDNGRSLDWAYGAGCRVINLLAKGSLNHLRQQLGKTPEEHISDIKKEAEKARSLGMEMNVYLEDWSNGMLHSENHVLFMINNLKGLGVKRIMLADTLGILNSFQVEEFVSKLKNGFPSVHFDFHGHNDYGLATANALAAVKAGVNGVHVSMNNLGERAGNASLDEVVVSMKDFLGINTGINEKELFSLKKIIEEYSLIKTSAQKPITGENVFTQTAGVHADGDRKANLYVSRLNPARFNRKTDYALGKQMGKASLEINLQRLGINLSPEQKLELQKRIKELSDAKESVTLNDIDFLVSGILDSPEKINYKIQEYEILLSRENALSKLHVLCGKKEYFIDGKGDGGYDASMNALRKLFLKIPELVDYESRIPLGGKTDALVETIITWQNGNEKFKTRGVKPDQVASALEATEKMLNKVRPEIKS
jgi:D-citramalate synthase